MHCAAATPHAADDDPHPGLGSRQRQQTLVTASPPAAAAAPLHASCHQQSHTACDQQPHAAHRQPRDHASHAEQAHPAVPQSATVTADRDPGIGSSPCKAGSLSPRIFPKCSTSGGQALADARPHGPESSVSNVANIHPEARTLLEHAFCDGPVQQFS
eukprot:798336-Pelagomonas_calceolata.AAC.2